MFHEMYYKVLQIYTIGAPKPVEEGKREKKRKIYRER